MSKNTDFSASNPSFCQLLSFVPRDLFKKCVSEHNSDKWYKTMKTWDQFVTISYAVLTGTSSLRSIELNFSLLGNKIHQLGLHQTPCRSSISHSNINRPSSVFKSVYFALYAHYHSYLKSGYLSSLVGQEIDPRKVEVFDSTTITLFQEVFKGCGRLPENGRKKGGVKAFTKITLAERVPNYVVLRDASTSEREFLDELPLSRGTIGVFDKGFHKYEQYDAWDKAGVYYLTRANQNARFEILGHLDVPDIQEDGVQRDMRVKLNYTDKQGEKQHTQSRMVSYIDPVSKKKLVFLTNLPESVSANTISMLYKNRWTIEPLFKQIKQNFELTYFLSDSREGIQTQIWVALILNLIFTVIHKQIKEAVSFMSMVTLYANNANAYLNIYKIIKEYELWIKTAKRDIKNVQLCIFEEISEPSNLKTPT
ncbi:MAG: IS4 family transposase [Flavobacteriaceae bacterium]|nr:IS4 family transposase [Flavobacteriaceae bacterium]